MNLIRIIASFCLLIPVGWAMAETVAIPTDNENRPAIGLVLSGGGARGAAHLGVLKVLEQNRIPVDFIAGTSMGAIIGGLYASGLSLEQIESALSEIDWDDILLDDPRRKYLPYRKKREDDEFLVESAAGFRDGEVRLPAGLLQGQKLLLKLKSLTLPVAHVRHFDQLHIPFCAVTTDISNGKMVILDSGDLALAMRASAAIPSVFSPVEIDGKLLVDGGVSGNLPVSVVQQMGAQRIIAVDISTPLTEQAELDNVLAITDQLTTILTRNNTEASLALLEKDDILIVPNLGDITSTSFDRSMEAIEPGRTAANAELDQLRNLSLNPEEYAEYQAGLPSSPDGRPIIQYVQVNNHSSLADEVINARIDVPLGEPLDHKALDRQIAELYGMDLFEQVNYEIVESGGQKGLQLNVVEKSWGPGYIQGGLRFHSYWSNTSGFTLGGAFTQTGFNPLGGEWRSILQFGEDTRLFTEFYQPLDYGSTYFINPRIDMRRFTIGYYESGNHVADYLLSEAELALEAGRELGTWGELRAGWRVSKGEFELKIGDSLLPEDKFDSGMLFVRFGLDTLDNRYFATRGNLAHLQYSAYREYFGGDDSFDQIEASWFGARSLGRNTLIFKGSLGYTLDDDAPVYGLYTVGGFFNLSGFDNYELTGQQKLVLIAGGMRRLGDFQFFPIYAGATLEAGNTWERAGDIGNDLLFGGSLFLGLDTVIGPLYMGVGAAEQDQSTAFIILGSPF